MAEESQTEVSNESIRSWFGHVHRRLEAVLIRNIEVFYKFQKLRELAKPAKTLMK